MLPPQSSFLNVPLSLLGQVRAGGDGYVEPSLVEGKPETLDKKTLPGKQLVGLEPTASHTVVERFNR